MTHDPTMPRPPVYADTSFLVSHLIVDANTESARKLIRTLRTPLMISPLGRLEFQTAMWQRVGRGEFEPSHARRAVAEFLRQEAKGWFVMPKVQEDAVWKRAAWLTETYTADLKLRSLDLWHVGFALESGACGFWTFDERQSAVATAVGLEVNP